MPDAENWIKLLYTYGPFALLVFFLFVGEAKARSAVKDAIPEAKREGLVIYALTWAAIFGLLIVAVSAWYQNNFPKEFDIAGQLQGLQGSETIYVETSSPDSALYLNKQYLGRSSRFTYHWRLVSQKRLPDGEAIRIMLDPGNENQPAWSYTLKVLSDYYAQPVTVLYDRGVGHMKVSCGTRPQEELTGLPETEATAAAISPRPSFWHAVVYAQSRPNIRQIVMGLESNDPIMRRNARYDLVAQGAAALPALNQLLSDPGSSYRLRLGGISALNQMKGVDMKPLSPAAFATVQKATSDPDVVLRTEAGKFLAAHPAPPPPPPAPATRVRAVKR